MLVVGGGGGGIVSNVRLQVRAATHGGDGESEYYKFRSRSTAENLNLPTNALHYETKNTKRAQNKNKKEKKDFVESGGFGLKTHVGLVRLITVQVFAL